MRVSRTVKVAAAAALALALFALAGCSLLAPAEPASWPASQTGRPTFYYFGDPG